MAFGDEIGVPNGAVLDFEQYLASPGVDPGRLPGVSEEEQCEQPCRFSFSGV